jgi:RimJ/RimL family protein N-acetyltransferase
MAHRDDLRYQCYLLDHSEEAEFLARARCMADILDSQAFKLYDDLPDISDDAVNKTSYLKKAADHINEKSSKYFILWDAKTKRIIGYSELDIFTSDEFDFIDNFCAEFGYSFIIPEMRKRGLANLFYNARFEYLKETGITGIVLAWIVEENEASMKVAARHGFTRRPDYDDSQNVGREFNSVTKDSRLELLREIVYEDPKPFYQFNIA